MADSRRDALTGLDFSEFRQPCGKFDRVLGTYEPRNLYYTYMYTCKYLFINVYVYICSYICIHIRTYLRICMNKSMMPMLAFAAGNSVGSSLTRFSSPSLYVFRFSLPQFSSLSLFVFLSHVVFEQAGSSMREKENFIMNN